MNSYHWMLQSTSTSTVGRVLAREVAMTGVFLGIGDWTKKGLGPSTCGRLFKAKRKAYYFFESKN